MKYRIKYIDEIGYFAQYKRGFSCEWRTIGKHVNGYGGYSESNTDHPLETYSEAENRCLNFELWDRRVNRGPVYTDITKKVLNSAKGLSR